MQQAVGATPPRLNMQLFYGRDMDVGLVQGLTHRLSEYVWDSNEPPAEASPMLLHTAEAVLERLVSEHDTTMYDPDSWVRIHSWYLMRLCTLILDGRLQEASDLLCTDETRIAFQRPAPRLLPRLCDPVPAAEEDVRAETMSEVIAYTNLMNTAQIDDLYKRALIEIHLDKLHEKRSLVYDLHSTLVLIDATFFIREEDRIDRDHPLYRALWQLELSLAENHYLGNTTIPYLPHLHIVCRWIAYANQLGMGICIVLAIGNSRCRDAGPGITGICWVSEHLCGFYSAREELLTDASNVWDMIVILNKRYVPS